MITYGERVTVYTGPGRFYRPLLIVPSGTEMPAATSPVKNKHGEFFKVLVTLSDKRKAIGYVPVDSEIRKKSSADLADDMESFQEYPLAKHSLQATYAHLRTERRLVTVGYMKYVAPGFYLKGFAGSFLSPGSSSPLIGAEFGNDALLLKRLSGFASYTMGVFLRPKKDTLFEGSKNDLSNFLVQGALGLRLNFGEVASISLGATQVALVSANNSLVTFGGLATLEWGL
ncbi:MAG: hypothetical protein NDI61_06105 [Bdellovibrionaceae bacterium]|nr:hypothetical protein [Pseudobdellovibrionaceae bacterium]